LGEVQQLLITGTDWDRFPPDFLAHAARFEVEDGRARPLTEAEVT
jgi:hypothetical protein